MANVAFKRGLSANLPAAGSAIDGVFYLTTDTNRLYVGNADKNIVDLNRYIKVVTGTDKLYPSTGVSNDGLAAGDFVWVSNGNMLLVCTDPKGTTLTNTWTQINPPDTDSDTKVTGLDLSDAVDATNNKITITLTLDQTTTAVVGGKSYTSPAQKTASIELTKAELDSVLDHAVSVATEAISEGGAKIKNTGNGSGTGAVSLKPGDNITISVSGSDITVSAKDTKYDLNTAASASTGLLQLAAKDASETDTITFKSGNDAIAVASDAKGNITYTHKAYTTTGSESDAGDNKPAHGGTFTVIDGITADKGHVTGYTTKEITLPTDNNTTYAISALTHDSKAKVRLTAGGSGSGTDDVVFAAGEDLTVAAANDVVTYTHKDYGDLSSSDSAEGDENPVHGGSFLVVDSISASNGHITGYTTKNVKLPTDLNTKNSEVTVTVGANASGNNNAGSIVVAVKDSDSNTKTGRADNVLYTKITVDGTEKTVYNQGSLGSFYSAAKIEEKLNAVNAMTYKGTVGSSGATVTALPSSGVKIGDTYKVATKGTYGGHSCDVGDLLIATGTESSGVITSTTLTWTYVPSGDDTDTQHNVSVKAGTDAADIVLGNNTGASTTDVTIAAGTAINVTGDEASDTITIAHENVTRSDGTNTAVSPAAGKSFTVVDEVSTNDQGHVTGIKTKTVNLPTDSNTTYAISTEDVTGSAAANLVLTAGGSGSGTDKVAFKAGDGLTVEGGTDAITFAHEIVDTDAENDTDAATLTHNGTFTAISDVKVNERGHVTGLVTKTYTMPSDNNTKYDLSVVADHKIVLAGNDSTSDTITFANDDYITLTDTVADGKITIGHKDYTATTLGSSTTTATTLAAGTGKFKAVVGVTRDAGGHITEVKEREWTLPADNNTTYSYAGAVASKTVSGGTGATYTTTLTGSDSSTKSAVLDITSTSLQVAAGTNAMAIDMVWGSF